MKKEHATKCASRFCKYHAAEREQYPNVMGDCDCDGYHTFNELYDHRITLYIGLCRMYTSGLQDMAGENGHIKDVEDMIAWRSKNHSDGKPAFGGTWFVLGIGRSRGSQITYHLPMSRWEETEFAETLDKAPEFDGHTSDDVLERLKAL